LLFRKYTLDIRICALRSSPRAVCCFSKRDHFEETLMPTAPPHLIKNRQSVVNPREAHKSVYASGLPGCTPFSKEVSRERDR
jgi:hypothetical protein